jgi:beta-1,4-mannosyl-glycoprotein beta-1,4-N-acetylglucosaminyltransferase
MIIDTLLFNDEFDMLDIHLAITSNYVDRWIVLEASRTFSGLEKPYHLSNNISRYQAIWGDRIQVIQLPLTAEEKNLICETKMRRGFASALKDCNSEDIIVHGDLDEIIDPNKWAKIVELMDKENRPVSCGFEMYMYKVDQRAERGWKGSVVARRRMFDTPHDLYKGDKEVVKRKNRSHCSSLNEPVGWHWTWMGNDALIKNKVVSCIEHQNKDPDQMLTAFKNLDTVSAINHKCVTHVVPTVYPEKVQQVLCKYPNFWHNPPL